MQRLEIEESANKVIEAIINTPLKNRRLLYEQISKGLLKENKLTAAKEFNQISKKYI